MIKNLAFLLMAIIFAGCQSNVESGSVKSMQNFAQDTKIVDVINYEKFDNLGRLIFPANRDFDKNLTLKNSGELLI